LKAKLSFKLNITYCEINEFSYCESKSNYNQEMDSNSLSYLVKCKRVSFKATYRSTAMSNSWLIKRDDMIAIAIDMKAVGVLERI